MENKSHAVIAVSFLLVFLSCVALVFMWLHRGPPENRHYVIMSAYSVSGLQKESPVKYKGIRVGSVKDIRFDPREPDKVLVDISVYPHAYITHATYAVLATRGITGVSYISLSNTPGQSRTPLETSAKHPARIPMQRSLLQSLLASGGGDLNRISGIIDNLGKLLSDDNRRRFTATLRHLDKASRRLSDMTQRLAPAVQALPEVVADTRDLVDEGHHAMRDVDRLVQTARAPVRDAGAAARSVSKLSAATHQLARKVREQTLPRLDATLLRMNRTLMQIEALSRELQSKPQSLIFGTAKRTPGPGEQGFQAPRGGADE